MDDDWWNPLPMVDIISENKIEKRGGKMGRFDELEGIAKRQMTLFFMVDVSGSMAGDKIGTVNSTMQEIIPELMEISASNADAAIKVAVLTFSRDCKWINPRPIDISEFEWSDLTVGTVTNFGAACEELNSKLSRNEFMKDAVGAYAPVIILLSDGSPTDDYRGGLGALEQNNWYKAAIKAAIAIGRDVDTDVLEDFTKSSENVIRVYNPEELKKWIKFVTITASKIGSTSSSSTGGKNDEFINAVKEEKEQSTVGDGVMPPYPSFVTPPTPPFVETPPEPIGGTDGGSGFAVTPQVDPDDFVW